MPLMDNKRFSSADGQENVPSFSLEHGETDRLSFLNLTDSNWPFASPPSRGRSRFKDSNYPLSPSLLLSEFTFRMRRHKQTFFEVNKSFLPNLRDQGE